MYWQLGLGRVYLDSRLPRCSSQNRFSDRLVNNYGAQSLQGDHHETQKGQLWMSVRSNQRVLSIDAQDLHLDTSITGLNVVFQMIGRKI